MNQIKNFLLWFLVGYFGTLVIIHCVKAGGPDCEPIIKTVFVEKIVYVDRPTEVEIPRDVTKTNRLSFLAGQGPSDELRYGVSGTVYTVTHKEENVGGIMYQKDVDNLTLGVVGLSNRSLLLSVGVNW